MAGLNVTDNLDDLPRGHFGLITLHHVFEHLPEPTETLSQLRPLLAPNGALFIEVPNGRSLRARLSLPALSRTGWFEERHRAFPIHLAYYSPRTLQLTLESAGWRVVDLFTVGIGLDELRPDRPSQTQRTEPNRRQPPPATPKRKRVRHFVRDLFLRTGLGDNVAAVAVPG
jgi:hypothetical protein